MGICIRHMLKGEMSISCISDICDISALTCSSVIVFGISAWSEDNVLIRGEFAVLETEEEQSEPVLEPAEGIDTGEETPEAGMEEEGRKAAVVENAEEELRGVKGTESGEEEPKRTPASSFL